MVCITYYKIAQYSCKFGINFCKFLCSFCKFAYSFCKFSNIFKHILINPRRWGSSCHFTKKFASILPYLNYLFPSSCQLLLALPDSTGRRLIRAKRRRFCRIGRAIRLADKFDRRKLLVSSQCNSNLNKRLCKQVYVRKNLARYLQFKKQNIIMTFLRNDCIV
jgi:hypothetical protein